MGVQQWMGIQLLEHHLQQIQLCTCRSHCQQPKRLRLRHTFWKFSFWRIKCFNVTGWLIDRIWTNWGCASVYIRILNLTKLRRISNIILHDFETHAGFCQILFMRGFELWVSAKFHMRVVLQESHYLATSFEKGMQMYRMTKYGAVLWENVRQNSRIKQKGTKAWGHSWVMQYIDRKIFNDFCLLQYPNKVSKILHDLSV